VSVQILLKEFFMEQDIPRVTPKQTFALLNLIWAAFVLLILILAVVAWFGRPLTVDSLSYHIGAVILGVLSIVILMFQGKLRGNLTDSKLFPRFLDVNSWGLNPKASAKVQELQLPERGDYLMLQAHVVFRVLTWLAAAVMAAFGIFLTFMTGYWRFTGLFCVVAITTLFYSYPSYPMFVQQHVRWRKYLEVKGGKNRPMSSG
jgi:hypothetical protein